VALTPYLQSKAYRVNVFSCLFGVLCRPRHSLSDKTVRLVVITHQLRRRAHELGLSWSKA
jgi:hypothetical protein